MSLDKKVLGFVGATFIAVHFLYAGVANAEEYKGEGWPVPDLTNAKFLGERKSDILKGILGKESLEKGYKVSNGNYVHILIYDEKYFGYYVDTNGNYPMEYTLLDENGDGIFRNKYSREEIPTPEYLKKLN